MSEANGKAPRTSKFLEPSEYHTYTPFGPGDERHDGPYARGGA